MCRRRVGDRLASRPKLADRPVDDAIGVGLGPGVEWCQALLLMPLDILAAGHQVGRAEVGGGGLAWEVTSPSAVDVAPYRIRCRGRPIQSATADRTDDPRRRLVRLLGSPRGRENRDVHW